MGKDKTALFTANEDIATSFLSEINQSVFLQLMHLPLENYSYSVNLEEVELVERKMDTFSFIIHGNLRNARFFIQWVKEAEILDQVKEIVHLVPNQATVDFLADYEIPAIMPRKKARPIDIIEFMLRISRDGTVLYPTTDQRDEEVPGLLQELEMPVIEFQVCRQEVLPSETLEQYRDKAANSDFDSVIFHSRSSVNRIQIAFPDLDFSKLECISSGQAVTQKLQESGIEPTVEARGSWRSLLAALTE
ncbi:MAG: uroporphyrinogen-III synthase [Balneolaceae bacterium]|nr:uroporphyrinogen-III synthase [Balneolaceae bacterium]MDR9408755.1 uroporphyrinogen-III synthase [Balneolaceae bacterium]